MTRRRLHVLAVLAVLMLSALCTIGSTPAANAQSTPRTWHKMSPAPQSRAQPDSVNAPPGELVYDPAHGPVMNTNSTYAIYWIPSGYSVSTNYEAVVNQYFKDVAKASGKKTNVYYAATQYYSTPVNKTSPKKFIRYSSKFAGAVVVTDPLPVSNCTNAVFTVCLTDAQIQAEITSVMARKHWKPAMNKMYFLYTANTVGSCFASISGSLDCAYTGYCAYHGFINNGSKVPPTIYANMPYPEAPGNYSCDLGEHPNGDDADAVINVTSHEHNEAITDPLLNAWWDSQNDAYGGYENGDLCAWNFGALNGPSGAQYNQTIGKHNYFLQQEYSNVNGCVQSGK